MLQLDTPILATFGALTLALACLWLPNSYRFPIPTQWFWLLPLAAGILSGLHYGFLQPIALLSIALFGLACFVGSWSAGSRLIKRLSGGLVLLGGCALFLHGLPGFANPKLFSDLKLSPDAVPYSKYLNFDSALIGLGILGFGHRRLNGIAEWGAMLRRAAPVMLTTLLLVMLLSLWLSYVRWQPKWTELFIFWAWGNLFFTCIAEEAFFRGFIQKHLLLVLSDSRSGTVIALFGASILFGLAHWTGGIHYVLLATMAGMGYGLAYHRTQHIEASILTHFLLNSLHFLLFTYPVLASAPT